jgi:nitrite reductase/ring-hydroxylating ferredoxin subunit
MGWFYLCETRDVSAHHPKALRILDNRLIAFRDAEGSVRVTEGLCPHFGADLSKGCVKKGQVVCPFHGFRFSGEGQCVEAPGETSLPDFARLKAYKAVELCGGLYVYLGEDLAACDLPGFPDEGSDQDYFWSRPVKVEVEAPWFMAGMNEFDTRHFQYVHGRAIDEPVVHDFDPDGIAYTDLKLRNVSTSALNRFLRRLFGASMRLQIFNVMGLMKFAKTTVGPIRNRMIISIVPKSGHTCEAYIKVVAPRTGNLFMRALVPIWLRLLRYVSHAFFTEEADEIIGAVYNSETVTHRDRNVLRFMHWLIKVQVGASRNEAPTITRSRVGLSRQSPTSADRSSPT